MLLRRKSWVTDYIPCSHAFSDGQNCSPWSEYKDFNSCKAEPTKSLQSITTGNGKCHLLGLCRSQRRAGELLQTQNTLSAARGNLFFSGKPLPEDLEPTTGCWDSRGELRSYIGQLMASTQNALEYDRVWVSCRERRQKEWEERRLISTSKWKVLLICLHWVWKHDPLCSEQNTENIILFQPKVIIFISVIEQYSSVSCWGQSKGSGLGCRKTFVKTEFSGTWWHGLRLNQETK